MSTRNPKQTVSTATEVAKSIVKVQGTIFIKELLREKKRIDSTIRIGAGKDEILSNLVEAIEQGKIAQSELDEWVRSVEGWGKQHVYLYRVGAKLAKDPIWASAPLQKA